MIKQSQISALDKARQEQAIGQGWFDGNYTEESARLVTEQQGLSWELVQWWYGKDYHEMEASSNG
jgi:hypothetical protein